MKQITVRVCTGTTCFVMGAAQLESLAEHLPDDVAPYVDVVGSRCEGYCKDRQYGRAPFVTVDGELIRDATLPKILDTIVQRVRGQ